MGSHKTDPRQMTERERRFYEYKMSHRDMDLEVLGELERSMMLRLLVFLLKGPRTTREIYLDGEFYHSSMMPEKLKRLRELGLIEMYKQHRYTVVTLTDDGRDFASELRTIMEFLKRRMR